MVKHNALEVSFSSCFLLALACGCTAGGGAVGKTKYSKEELLAFKNQNKGRPNGFERIWNLLQGTSKGACLRGCFNAVSVIQSCF